MRIIPKKSLGQNFLVDNNIRKKIVCSLGLVRSDVILEIGPGRGELTTLIAQSVDKVYALEIDKRLISTLNGVFTDFDNINLINEDILKFDLAKYFLEKKFSGKLKVFGNIPYYISSPIIEHLIQHRWIIDSVFITVQKEFARRVVSLPGSKEYGSFSCFVQYYMKPKIIFDISRNCFYPSPKVDSSFLELKIRESAPVSVKDEAGLFKIIRRAFNQRRKILSNSLSEVVRRENLLLFFEITGHTPKVRPEELSLKDFALLANLQNN